MLVVNSLWPSDAIQWHRLWSTLAKVKAWCPMRQSHYLNQCWLTLKGVLWHSSESNFTRSAHELNQQHVFRDYILKITTTFSSGQCVNTFHFTNHFAVWSLSLLSYYYLYAQQRRPINVLHYLHPPMLKSRDGLISVSHITGLVINYGISNTVVLEIP